MSQYNHQWTPQPGFVSGYQVPVYNPPIPLILPLMGGIKPGLMIYISGKPTVNFHKFTINFLKRDVRDFNNSDIAFHLNPRFEDKLVIRNSRINGEWGEEERLTGTFPFAPGYNFDMIIRVEGNRFLIAVNGRHLVEFYHRLQPLQAVDTLQIEGDIGITSIRFHVE